jgi:hypothetical protein
MKGSELLTRAAILLQDQDHLRWPLTELVSWANDGQKTIVAAKPSANSQSVPLSCAEGTLQSLTDPTHLMLLRLPRNLASNATPRVGGRAIRPVSREVLDASEPYWHVRTTVPFKKEVRQYVFDEQNPREFYVYPGNDGTGVVEAVVSVLPTAIAPSGNPEVIGSYDAELALREPYGVALVDYVVSRAFAKDDVSADPGRAALHMQAFMNAIGIKAQVESAQSPNARAKVVST